MIEDHQIYLSNRSRYVACMHEIANILKTTLSQIEEIYYQHILFPKLQEYHASL
jgi:hypothetical protein